MCVVIIESTTTKKRKRTFTSWSSSTFKETIFLLIIFLLKCSLCTYWLNKRVHVSSFKTLSTVRPRSNLNIYKWSDSLSLFLLFSWCTIIPSLGSSPFFTFLFKNNLPIICLKSERCPASEDDYSGYYKYMLI